MDARGELAQLIELQLADGSWPGFDCFYTLGTTSSQMPVHFGSALMTASICIRALTEALEPSRRRWGATLDGPDHRASIESESVMRTLGYPFAAREQGAREVGLMREFTPGYLRRHRMFSDIDLYADTVVHFARFCTPKGTSDAGLSSACMYMAWVLFLDDVGGGSLGDVGADIVSRHCEILRAIREDGSHPEPASSAEAALLELASTVKGIAARKGLGFEEFCERLVAMMRAQQWERDRSGSTSRPFSRTDYLRVRPAAIGNGAFVSIMKLDHGVDVDRFDPLAKSRAIRLDELATCLVYLSNDILSQHREERESRRR